MAVANDLREGTVLWEVWSPCILEGPSFVPGDLSATAQAANLLFQNCFSVALLPSGS